MEKIIDRMAEIKLQTDALNEEYERLSAEILKHFAADTENSKRKYAEYSSEKGTVTVCESNTVSVRYPQRLRGIFGKTYGDMVEKDVSYKLTAKAKQILAAIYSGEYMELEQDKSLEDMIMSLPCGDDRSMKMLVKKLRGKDFEKDKANLMKYGGFDEENASDYAYILCEAANWCRFRDMLSLSGKTEKKDFKRIIEKIRCTVSVSSVPKVTLRLKTADSEEQHGNKG